MNKNMCSLLLSSFLTGLLFLLVPITIATASGVEAQVPTEGKITFYESQESFPSDSSTKASSSSSLKNESTNYSSSEKPKGSLPSTGEMIQRYSLLGGGILLLALLLWLRMKKKREDGSQ